MARSTVGCTVAILGGIMFQVPQYRTWPEALPCPFRRLLSLQLLGVEAPRQCQCARRSRECPICGPFPGCLVPPIYRSGDPRSSLRHGYEEGSNPRMGVFDGSAIVFLVGHQS